MGLGIGYGLNDEPDHVPAPSRYVCAHCGGGIVGIAFVHADGKITHGGHSEAYERTKRGLIHDCPQCETRGKLTDHDRPVKQTRRVPNPCAWGAGDGMMDEEYTSYPFTKPCDLCAGEGYLDKPAVPVTETKQTGWRRG